MGIPSEVVLEGYSLIEQHEIDHQFLLQGSPLSLRTPLLLALTLLGVTLVGLAVLCRVFRKRGALASGLIGAALAVIKLWWLPIALAIEFSDVRVAGYTLYYYPQYWLAPTIVLLAVAVLGLAAAISPWPTRRR